MPRPQIRLQPHKSETVEDLPLGFEASEDIAKGNVYADASGNLVSRAELDKKLRSEKDVRRMVRVALRYWMPGDPKEGPPRRTFVNIPVIGHMDSDELGRVVHAATRKVHDAIRERGDTPDESYIEYVEVWDLDDFYDYYGHPDDIRAGEKQEELARSEYDDDDL